MMWDGNGWDHAGGWEGWMMFVFMILFVVAVVFLIRYLAQTSGSPAAGVSPPPPAGPESPKDILKRRYAAGEIDREEYLQRLGDL